MEIITNVNCDAVRKIIEKQGHGPEHNFYHYMNVGAMYESCVFPIFEGKYGILGFVDKGDIWCYTDPLAPEEKRLAFFAEFVRWAFKDGAKKVRAEISEELWRMAKALKEYRFVKPSYIYYCPVYDLKRWDPALPGTAMKKLRNLRNAFQRNHKIEIVGKDAVSRRDILNILDRWKKHRQASDRAKQEHYVSAVNNGFLGYDSVRFIVVDGVVHAMNGGWKIPNSNNFYSQLGIQDYAVDDMGEFSYLEDLAFLKSAGYDFADFGGGGKELTKFKQKFRPSDR